MSPPTVVLTGVSTGIGRAGLEKLLTEGCHVFGSVRKQSDANCIAREVGGLPGTFTPLIFDITDTDAVKAGVRKVEEALNGATLTALINNAGMNVGPDPMGLIAIDKLKYQLEVNLIAPVIVTQAFLPLLGTDRCRKGDPGRVVFVGSVYGSYGLPFHGPYCATKHALEGLSECLRLEMRLFGIEVIIIRPGPVRSEIWNKSTRGEGKREGGTGDWELYANSQYAAALATTRKFVLKELDSRTFLLPCEVIADEFHKAVTMKEPKLQVVKTPRYLLSWILPRWMPVRLRDRAIAKKCGIRPLYAATREAREDLQKRL